MHRLYFRNFMIIGQFLLALSTFLIGGNFSSQPVVQSISGQALLGIAASCISAPLFPELIDSIEQVEELEEYFDEEYLEEFISQKLGLMRAVAIITGPILSSQIVQHNGFTNAMLWLSVYLVTFSMIYMAFCSTCRLKVSADKKTNNMELVKHHL